MSVQFHISFNVFRFLTFALRFLSLTSFSAFFAIMLKMSCDIFDDGM